MPRPSFQEHAFNLARIAAMRSEDYYRKVGACALDFNNRVLGVAYNGLAPNMNVSLEFLKDRDYRRKFFIHAETNLFCLHNIKRGECKTIAVTCFPCTDCAKNIAAYGVKEVVYGEDYSTDNNAALEIFKFYGINVIKMESTLKL